MSAWSFPQYIKGGADSIIVTRCALTSRSKIGVTLINVEFESGLTITESDDGGEVDFTIQDYDQYPAFEIQARAPGGNPNLQIYFYNLQTTVNALGSTMDIGFNSGGYTFFVLSSSFIDGPYFSNVPGTSWMQDMMMTYSDVTLRNFCMPGSHDSGMSIINGSTFGVTSEDVITQKLSVGGQLDVGARYFDIRPVISSGYFKTGHYSCSSTFGVCAGANGQSIQSIVSDINAFTAQNAELIILNLSHDMNTDADYRGLNQNEWISLFSLLYQIDHLYFDPNPYEVDLSTYTLGDFISDSAAVIVIVNSSDVTLGNYAYYGFFPWTAFPVFNSYTGTDNLNSMINDQIGKMNQHRPNENTPPFLLSWTLTQSATDVITDNSILDLAAEAYPYLFYSLASAVSPRTFPNIIYIDNVADPAVAGLAIAIDMYWQNSF